MKRLLMFILLLLFATPLDSTVIIYEKSTGKFLDFITRPNKVKGCMQTRIIPGWYGEANGVMVICDSDTSGLQISKGDSVVVYNYERELERVGLIEILSDSIARIIVRSKSFKLNFNIETGTLDSILIDNKAIPIKTKRLK